MISSYLPILLSLVLAILFPLGLLFITSILGPHVDVRAKMEPYECGVPAKGSAHIKIPVKYYRLAILFVLFDVEAAFLFPWAILFRPQASYWGVPFLVAEAFLFLAILLVGYLYAWRQGGLEWD
ncbi:MAG TPA: NADH-quinone oxidoreductase subunit A [Bdellovibrionota bacterium]|nr:NADH-quinone oxidoreductase subunit A [Bdellovibrionota bacterium]